jgi:hypothetical protein
MFAQADFDVWHHGVDAMPAAIVRTDQRARVFVGHDRSYPSDAKHCQRR